MALGQVPPSMYTAMAVPYMEGTFDLPIKYGYSLVGTVEEGPADWVGRTVYTMHPHQDWCRISADDLFPVPEGIPPKRAALTANVETALNAVWDAGVSVGDRVLIVGFGVIGAMLACILSRMPAVECVVVDIDPDKRKLAQSLGCETAAPGDALPVFDMAFHTSTSAEGLQLCIDRVGFEGTVVELSWYGTRPVELHLGHDFHNQRKRILSAQVSTIEARRARRWDYARRKATVFDLLRDDRFDLCLTHTVPFLELPEFFDQLRAGTVQPVGCVVGYGDAL